MLNILSSAERNTSVSVLGLYSGFQALRSGSQGLRRLGFDDRDFSVLFFEDAVTSCNDTESSEWHRFSTDQMSRHLIGGTFESLSYLDVWEQGIITGAIMSIGIPRNEAEGYETGICNGRLLLCVRSTSPAYGDVAMKILLHSGAESIVAVPHSRAFSQLKTGEDVWWESASSLEARLIS